MRVNLEELACLVLAFSLLAGNIAVIGLSDLLTTDEQELSRGLLQIAGVTVLSFLALIAVYKIPNSWWFHIVYESENQNEIDEADDANQVGYLH